MDPERMVAMIASLREQYAKATDPAERIYIGEETIYLEDALMDWLQSGGCVPANLDALGKF